MTNSVEIVVEGKDEATKVFQKVESTAKQSATTVEQSWSRSMDSVTQSMTRASGSVDRSSDSLDKMGNKAKDSGDKLDRLGEASDNVDTRAMGFRDTVTGVQDTLKGLSDQSLSTGDRLFTLGAGIGDLGSAGYNLAVPAMKKMKDVISEVNTPTTRLGENVKGLGKSIAGMAAGAAIIAGIGYALHKAFGDEAANVGALTYQLAKFTETGKAGGEASRVLGDNFDDLKTSIEEINGSGFAKFIEGIYDLIPGSDLVGVSMSEAKDKVAALDQALTQLAQQSPEEASKAFDDMASKMGLTSEQVTQLKNSLPGFTSAMQQADAQTRTNTDGTVKNTQALRDYLAQLQAATDPVFNLLNSLNQVSEAQNAYNDAVKTYGQNSTEAKDASVQLAEAIAGAEAAALNGDISYDNFAATLSHWVQAGVLTAQQAANIRQRVAEARGEADNYVGNYDANLFMEDHASRVIQNVQGALNSVPDSTYKKFYMTYIQNIIGSAPSGAPPGYGFIGNRATGGPIGHAATGGGRSGLTLVGEQGPELVNLPVGSRVNPSGASSRWSGGGSSEIKVTLDLQGADRGLMDYLRGRIRVEGGGNVQVALGQG